MAIETMNEMAQAMIDWAGLKERLDGLGAEIEQYVLELGKTQTVGNVCATYSKGRTAYDYEAVVVAAMPDELSRIKATARFIVEKTDWRAVCNDYGFNTANHVKSAPVPSVKVKIIP